MNDSAAPKISLVVPTFNAIETIARSIDSAIAQEGVDLQLIVVDGGSCDGTAEWLRAREDHFAHLVIEPDGGQADALNKGFRLAAGEFFGWLCADDTLEPGALAQLVKALQADSGAVLATGGCTRVFGGGREVSTTPEPDFADRVFHMNTIEQPSTIWRAAAHCQAGPLDTRLHYAFDWEYWCRLRKLGSFVAVCEPLSRYYFSEENKTSAGGDAIAREMFQVVRRHGPRGGSLAYAYRFLYATFDRAGFYDPETRDCLPAWRRGLFHLTLRALQLVFGKDLIDSYNWNFASRQARGLDWL
jgi:glycosyltransferase involved in cell wall biosynthesis